MKDKQRQGFENKGLTVTWPAHDFLIDSMRYIHARAKDAAASDNDSIEFRERERKEDERIARMLRISEESIAIREFCEEHDMLTDSVAHLHYCILTGNYLEEVIE